MQVSESGQMPISAKSTCITRSFMQHTVSYNNLRAKDGLRVITKIVKVSDA